MWAWVSSFAAAFLGSAGSRVMTGAGLALATFTLLTPLVLAALNLAASHMSAVPAGMAALIIRSGLGITLSAIGSAMMTRVGIEAALVGIKKAS